MRMSQKPWDGGVDMTPRGHPTCVCCIYGTIRADTIIACCSDRVIRLFHRCSSVTTLAEGVIIDLF